MTGRTVSRPFRYHRDPYVGLHCTLILTGSTCDPGTGCTISYCEDGETEQATEDNRFAVRLATPNEES